MGGNAVTTKPMSPEDQAFYDQPRNSVLTDKRQVARMSQSNLEKQGTIVAWDPRLALDIVLAGAEKAMEVFDRYKIDKAVAVELLQNPVFLKQLERYKAEVETSGLSFRGKARILAEDLLPHGYEIATDPAYPAAVRADMIQWFTKIADLEPKKDDPKGGGGGGGFSLQILFAGAVPTQTLVGASSAVPIEHES